MPAHLGFATIVRKGDLLATLSRVWPIAIECLGPLRTQSVQNFVKTTMKDSSLATGIPKRIPAFSDDELIAFYPDKMPGGSLMLSHEGDFDVIMLSAELAVDVEEVAKQLWFSSSNVLCVLAGEELEVEEEDIRRFSSSLNASDMPPLCTVALVGCPEPGELRGFKMVRSQATSYRPRATAPHKITPPAFALAQRAGVPSMRGLGGARSSAAATKLSSHHNLLSARTCVSTTPTAPIDARPRARLIAIRQPPIPPIPAPAAEPKRGSGLRHRPF